MVELYLWMRTGVVCLRVHTILNRMTNRGGAVPMDEDSRCLLTRAHDPQCGRRPHGESAG